MDRNGFDDRDEVGRYKMEQIRKESGDDGEAEFAAEVAPAPGKIGDGNGRKLNASEEERPERAAARTTDDEAEAWPIGRTIGWTALALAIVSLFMYPVVFGMSAAVLGIIAYMQGSRSLGAWSVVIGGIALIAYLVLIPYYA